MPTYITIGKPRRDIIELPVENDLDINGWDIFKALALLGRSNPPLMEWLFSPLVYLEIGSLAESMRDYVGNHYSHRASSYHYLHMAEGNYKSYINGRAELMRKKYLYVLRPLICIEWMRSRKSTPPTSFVEALNGLMFDPIVSGAIRDLIEEKIAGEELGMGPPDPVLDNYIGQALEDLGEWVLDSPVKKPDYRELDTILHREIL